jgi:DNA-binding NtrC family response regulator
MLHLYAQLERLTPTRARVLIVGESGTGKELVAQALHQGAIAHRVYGGRATAAPFVRVNCAAIAPDLIERELFGHERGAFSGAHTRSPGLFEQAHGGTLLFDEIGEMALPVQAKVLRVLESGEVLRLGGAEQPLTVSVRVLAATHGDLEAEVAAGRFREDLYFRFNVVTVRVPPLRERREDLPLLLEQLLSDVCRDNGLPPKQLEPAFVQRLLQRFATYPWPGNVRELRNLLERLAILAEDRLDVALLDGVEHAMLRPLAPAPQPLAPAPQPLPAPTRPRVLPAATPWLVPYAHLTLHAVRELVERDFIRMKLEELDWNISRTANALDIERTSLHKKIRALGLVRGARP